MNHSKPYLITVRGEILATDKNHYAQGWICLECSKPIKGFPYTDIRLQSTINSDLILNRNVRALPYGYYLSEKGINIKEPGNMIFAPGAMAAELYYKDNIAEIRRALYSNVENDVMCYYYNGLLTGIFSVLELFLSDLVLCLIFSDENVYLRSISRLNIKDKQIGEDLSPMLIDYYTNGLVYHRFEEVKKLFNNVLHLHLPNTERLGSYLHKRNNIVHRFAYSNINRMRFTEIDINVLNDLISECNDFVDKILKQI